MKDVSGKGAVISSLIYHWTFAFLTGFILISAIYSMFLGREYLTFENSIYDGILPVNEQGTKQVAGMEGYGITTHGSEGLVVNKPIKESVTRLVFWGDSFVEAIQVSDQKKFSEIVDSTWNTRNKNTPVQSLNIGLAGLDTRAFLQFSENVNSIYSPDYLFLMLGNADFLPLSKNPDLMNNVRNGNYDDLVSPKSTKAIYSIVNSLGLSSFTIRLKRQTFAFWNSQSTKQHNANKEGTVPLLDANLKESIRLQLRALKNIWGDKLVILYRERVTDFGRNPEEGKATELYQALIEESVSFIDTYDPLLAATVEGSSPYGFMNFPLGTGHLNEIGHQAVANSVLVFLESKI